jgi:hypothetical protein
VIYTSAPELKLSRSDLTNLKDKQEIPFECQKMALDIGDRAFDLAEAGASTAGEALLLFLRQYIATLIDELGACGEITKIDALKDVVQVRTRKTVPHDQPATNPSSI